MAALDRDAGRRALHVLQNPEAFAMRREIPRLALHALADSVRIHAQRGRVETAAQLLARLSAMVPLFDEHELLPLRPQARLVQAMAGAQLALARADEAGALRELEAAEALAAHIGRMGELLTVRALRSVLLAASADPGATSLLAEAAALADIGGMQRVLLDAHPEVARLLGHLPQKSATNSHNGNGSEAVLPRVVPAHAGALLTPNEAHILGLLSTGLSNKPIGGAMEISDETVKWHLKNLFAKLSAGSRKHAVGRARLLGLLPD